MKTADGLSGTGLRQSAQQWKLRSSVLADSMCQLIAQHAPSQASVGLDVGCQDGSLTDEIAARTSMAWCGVDPTIVNPRVSAGGADLLHGWAHELPVEDKSVDVVVFANVYEHVLPHNRIASLAELGRVLRGEGVVVGQIPNPYFPIESHSRLPLMGYLPEAAQKRYWRLARVPWGHDFYSVTIGRLRKDAAAAGLTMKFRHNFNYPVDVVPKSVRWGAELARHLVHVLPWAWQFVLVKNED